MFLIKLTLDDRLPEINKYYKSDKLFKGRVPVLIRRGSGILTSVVLCRGFVKETIVPYKIIIHDGKAHMDELLGSALLALHLGEEPESIERMDSQEAAAAVREGNIPPGTYFIDCGLVHDSGRGLYDHHQDRDSDSSALLIFNEFYPHLGGTDLHAYMELVSRVDTRGAMSLDDFDLIGESRDYLSFSQGILLRAFEEDPKLILKIVIAGLDDKISFERVKAEAASWLKADGNIEIQKVGELNVLRYLKKPPSALISPLRSAVGRIVEEYDVAAILSFDNKQPEARTLYRADPGHELVDFSRSEPAQTVFKHPGGFLMKFIPQSDDEWIELIQKSDLSSPTSG